MADPEKKKEKDPPNRSPVVPDPADPEMTAFLERQFDDDFPEKIECVQLLGPGARQRGHTVDTLVFKPDGKGNPPEKPGREKIVAWSNQFLALSQKHCDMVGRTQKYGVLVWNMRKAEKSYAGYPFTRTPGDGGLTDAREDDAPQDGFGTDRLLRRIDTIQADVRFREELTTTSMREVILQQGQLVDRLGNMLAAVMTKYMAGLEAIETAQSRAHERELAINVQKFKFKMLDEGASMVRGLVPVMVNKWTGKETIPTKESPESIALTQFINGLSKPQIDAAFSECDDEGKLVRRGVLSPEQTYIFSAVARCEIPAEHLAGLLDGPNKVQPDQIEMLRKIFREDQYLPLMALLITVQQAAEKKKEIK